MNSISQTRERLAQLLEASERKDPSGRAVDIFLIVLISLNVLAIILESESDFQQRFGKALYVFEVFSVLIFTLEYAMRVWSCVDRRENADADQSITRLKYVLTPMALIDLIAILPFYLAVFFSIDLRFLRVVRLLRVFKLTRYSGAMQVLLNVLKDEASSFMAAFFILFVLLIMASSGIYLIEHDIQPENFGSILNAMWWAMATLTTVGYGDVTPVTGWGRFFGGCITLVGMGMVALPAGILASAFSDQLHRRRETYSDKLDDALEDGVVDEQELAELDKLQEELGLSEHEANRLHRIVQSSRHTQQSHCPHCGEILHRRRT